MSSATWSATKSFCGGHLQQHSEPVYEIECELVDENGDYMRKNSNERIATSIMYKLSMMLGEEPNNLCPYNTPPKRNDKLLLLIRNLEEILVSIVAERILSLHRR